MRELESKRRKEVMKRKEIIQRKSNMTLVWYNIPQNPLLAWRVLIE
jgi:hypothetical protein